VSNAIRIKQQAAPSIEQGNFVLTLMPSLKCDLDCPHCYLSKTERRDPTRLPDEKLAIILDKIDAYYSRQGVQAKMINAYHYGGEPTSMGLDAFRSMLDTIDRHLPADKGYDLRHTILTSLVEVDLDEWGPLFFDRCGGFLQTSFDGRMRGGRYLRNWEEKMADARSRGLELSTISVVNSRLLQDGPEQTLDYLSDLGVVECSFLPFMWNEQNNGLAYDRLAPTMASWSEFMIRLTERWIERQVQGLPTPEVGQLRFILAQADNPSPVSNVAGQTLFLMPNGDFALPDYRNGWQEYMNRFGNGLALDFDRILASPRRRAYMRRQLTRNGNSDCLSCSHADKCVMEFWKENREGDDCFGGKRYVEWLLANRHRIEAFSQGKLRTVSLY
jgi:sulfatase maturation enzyme AslB (radical SAM superfamily)